MDTINERVLFLIKDLGYNKNSFSKALGKSNSVVIEGIVGRRGSKPNADTLAGIMQKFPEVNADWLLTGKGKPYKIDPLKVSIEEFREKYENEYSSMYQWNPDKNATIKQLEQKIELLEATIEARDKHLEDKDKIIAATQKVVEMFEEYKRQKEEQEIKRNAE